MKARREQAVEPTSLGEMRARKLDADRRQAEAAQRLARKTADDRERVAQFRRAADAEAAPSTPAEPAPAAPAIDPAVDAQIRETLGQDLIARTPRRIIAQVAEEYGLTAADITGQSRDANTVRARFAAIAAVKKAHPTRSLPWLGRQFGDRDHTTMLHALRELGLLGGPAPDPVLASLVEGADGMRAVGALALPDMPPTKHPGPSPTMRSVDPTTLLVDLAYQRRLSKQSLTLIRRIIAEWSWSAFKPPIVVEGAKGLHVIDGQHTAIAAATHPDIREIPVLVVQAAQRAARAEAFVRHNRDRIQITGMQLHASLVAAGDPTSLGVEKACQAAGARVLRISPAGARYGVGDTMAIETLNRLVRRHGVDATAAMVRVCVEGDLAPVAAPALRAVEALLAGPTHAGRYEPSAISETMRALGPNLDRKATVFAATNKATYWQGLLATPVQNTRRKRGTVGEA